MNISQVYNYLNHDLVPKRRTRTHKASELKAVYNSISKYNQSSPLYLVSLSESRQTHMIDIKEQALTLRDITDQLANPESELYTKKQIFTDNPDAVSGSFRAHATGELPDQMTLQIDQLASEQVNIGNYLASDDLALTPGSYSFSMQTEHGSLPFTLSVSDNGTNLSLQQQLADQINRRHIDIRASIIKEGSTSALMLTSNDTGTPATDTSLYFSFNQKQDTDVIDTFGLNQVNTYPENARFYINDLVHSSASNHISINQMAEFDFHKTTDSPVNVHFTPDRHLLVDQLTSFTDAYNQLVTLSEEGEPTTIGSRNLYHDISGIVSRHEDQLASIGITVGEDRRLTLNAEQAVGISYDSLNALFGADSGLRQDISKAVNRLTLDPLAYVDRLIVTYPNAKEKQTATYTQSVYSGLMYNNYA